MLLYFEFGKWSKDISAREHSPHRVYATGDLASVTRTIVLGSCIDSYNRYTLDHWWIFASRFIAYSVSLALSLSIAILTSTLANCILRVRLWFTYVVLRNTNRIFNRRSNLISRVCTIYRSVLHYTWGNRVREKSFFINDQLFFFRIQVVEEKYFRSRDFWKFAKNSIIRWFIRDSSTLLLFSSEFFFSVQKNKEISLRIDKLDSPQFRGSVSSTKSLKYVCLTMCESCDSLTMPKGCQK